MGGLECRHLAARARKRTTHVVLGVLKPRPARDREALPEINCLEIHTAAMPLHLYIALAPISPENEPALFSISFSIFILIAFALSLLLYVVRAPIISLQPLPPSQLFRQNNATRTCFLLKERRDVKKAQKPAARIKLAIGDTCARAGTFRFIIFAAADRFQREDSSRKIFALVPLSRAWCRVNKL